MCTGEFHLFYYVVYIFIISSVNTIEGLVFPSLFEDLSLSRCSSSYFLSIISWIPVEVYFRMGTGRVNPLGH